MKSVVESRCLCLMFGSFGATLGIISTMFSLTCKYFYKLCISLLYYFGQILSVIDTLSKFHTKIFTRIVVSVSAFE